MNEVLEWGDFIATTWFGAGEDPSFLGVYDRRSKDICALIGNRK